jgi:hypothetical protein
LRAPRHRSFFAEAVTSYDFFPWGAYPFAVGPLGAVGFPPVVLWNEPVIVAPAPALAMPAPREAAGGVQIVPPAAARRATTDIPERLVEELLGGRRPTLAQRAHAARLEAAGDTMFRAGYFGRAADRYQQALAQTPDNDDVSFKRGAALAAANQYGESVRVLRAALRERPDWPFVPHDLTALFPDGAAIEKLLTNLDRESRRADSEFDALFLRAYISYFSGRREEAEVIFRNPPGGVAPPHFQVFLNAMDRER